MNLNIPYSPLLVFNVGTLATSYILQKHDITKCPLILQTNNAAYVYYAYPTSVAGEVYCFPRRQLIFSFDRRVIYHSKGL